VDFNKYADFFRDDALDSDKFTGEGLPAKTANHIFHKEFCVNFDVRLSHDENGNMELVIAEKGAGTHSKFQFQGLNARQARRAIPDFHIRLASLFIPRTIYQLAYACYWKQDDNRANRKNSCKNIITELVWSFERLLDLIRFKKVQEIKDGGLTITISNSTSTQGGTNPQTKVEIEKEKQEFKKAVFTALELIETEGGKKKPLDVGFIVFEKESDAKENIDIASRMKHALNKYKLNFKELLKEYEQKKASN
jgi:hypothetical protein